MFCMGKMSCELPGWTLEEVASIVNSIREDDWSSFHEVMSLGGVQGVLVQGSNMGVSYASGLAGEGELSIPYAPPGGDSYVAEGSMQTQGEEVQVPLPVYGLGVWTWLFWMGSSFSTCVGVYGVCCWVLEGLPMSVEGFCGGCVTCAWILSVLHRIWLLVLGPEGNWIQGNWRSFALRQGRPWTREEAMWALWVLLAILLGWACPAGAVPWDGSDGGKTIAEPQALVVAGDLRTAGPLQCSIGVPEVETELWVEMCVIVSKVLIVIVLWETFKRCWCRRTQFARAALVQTEEMGIVPMPLPDGVPNRPHILASLWRAGYRVDAEPYPPETQEEFFGLIGQRLRQFSEASSED